MEILVPIDGSDSAREAVEHAIRDYPRASLTVLHVLSPDTPHPAGLGGMGMHGSVIESQRNYTDQMFEGAIEATEAHSGPVTTKTTVGNPVREILAFAAESDADHIVIGGCSRSGLLRVLFGNVTEGVVRRAAVPVTVVKEEPEDG